MDYFAGIIGQERALVPLRQALASGKISHAYLLAGPNGVGKLTAAKALAMALILESDPQGEAYWRESAHPDFMLLDKLDNKTVIGIEQINRVMEPWLGMKPYRADRRVVIINDAHLMSLPAANALLKTLEDPPGHAVIILVAEDQGLLETIVSRCQLVRFSLVGAASLHKILLQRGIEEERAARLSRLGQGSVAAALSWAEEDLEKIREDSCSLLQALAGGGEIEVFRCAERLEAQPGLMINWLTATLRDICVWQAAGQEDLLIWADNLPLYRQFQKLDAESVKTALDKISLLNRQLRGPVNQLLLCINISYLLQDGLK